MDRDREPTGVEDAPAEPSAEEAAAEPSSEPETDRVQELEQENSELRDQLLRAVAETQNVLRRSRTDAQQAETDAIARVVQAILPALDNFERARASATGGASVESIIEGIEAVEKQLSSALARFGVERIESVGKPFDPHFHEAVQTKVTDELPEDTVTEEMTAGYKMGDRVVRPALVWVSKKP